MRVSAGKFKGRNLHFPRNIRPSSQLHKKVIFDTIRPFLTNSTFLDLYAGSGQIGIEALSQGALRITFVEKNKLSIKSVTSNLQNCSIENKYYQIIHSNVSSFLSKTDEQFDIIFADPPYLNVNWHDFEQISKLMTLGSIFILKYSPKNPPPDFPGLTVFKTKDFQDTNLKFYRVSSSNFCDL